MCVQKSGILSSLLWLVVCGDAQILHSALSLTLKVSIILLYIVASTHHTYMYMYVHVYIYILYMIMCCLRESAWYHTMHDVDLNLTSP